MTDNDKERGLILTGVFFIPSRTLRYNNKLYAILCVSLKLRIGTENSNYFLNLYLVRSNYNNNSTVD